MTTPRRLGDKLLDSLDDVLPFLRLYLVPQFKLFQRKLAAMSGTPDMFAVPVWDGESWHAALFGGDSVVLQDTDTTIDTFDGGHFLATDANITGDHTYLPVVRPGIQYKAMFLWNLTEEHTLTITLAGGDMVLAPMTRGEIRYDAAWLGHELLPVSLDPGKWP